MIANITQGNFVKGLLKYHKDKIKEGHANVFMTNAFISTDDKIIQNVLSAYNIESKRKDKNFHVSLNFTNSDYYLLDQDKQENIIKDYMLGLGFPEEHPYIAYLHKDKNHPHFHVVTSKILNDGKALNDKFIFTKSQRLTRTLEKKYNLTQINSLKNRKSKKKVSTLNIDQIKNLYVSYKNGNIELNKYLTETINYTLDNNNVINFQYFLNELKNNNIELKTTNHKKIKGLIYRVDGESRGVAASKLNKNYLFDNINKIIKENKKLAKEPLNEIGKTIDYIFYKYDTLNLPTYKKELLKRNIELKVNETNGVIRGFSYSYKGYKFKGQDLPGRKYTMSKIKHKFAKENKFNELSHVKYIFKKNQYLLDYTSYKTFIKTSLKHGMKPILSNNTIYLIPLLSDNKTINNTNSIPINQFNTILNKLSFEDRVQINNLINKYIDNLKDKKYNKEENLLDDMSDKDIKSIYEEIFESLNLDNFEDEDDLPRGKKKKKIKKL